MDRPHHHAQSFSMPSPAYGTLASPQPVPPLPIKRRARDSSSRSPVTSSPGSAGDQSEDPKPRRPRPKGATSRTVATLTPQQLEKKREADRKAQQNLRGRSKAHTARIESENRAKSSYIDDLEADNAHLRRREAELAKENERLRRNSANANQFDAQSQPVHGPRMPVISPLDPAGQRPASHGEAAVYASSFAHSTPGSVYSTTPGWPMLGPYRENPPSAHLMPETRDYDWVEPPERPITADAVPYAVPVPGYPPTTLHEQAPHHVAPYHHHLPPTPGTQLLNIAQVQQYPPSTLHLPHSPVAMVQYGPLQSQYMPHDEHMRLPRQSLLVQEHAHREDPEQELCGDGPHGYGQPAPAPAPALYLHGYVQPQPSHQR